jgi:hypothetical protein
MNGSSLRIRSMIYYFFPRSYIPFSKNVFELSSLGSHISPSLQHSLEELRFQIDSQCLLLWNKYASYFYNPYLWIYTPNHENKTISKLSLVYAGEDQLQTNYSSSLYFYEMIEIYHLMNLNWTQMKHIRTLHLGKNGFMIAQAVSFLRGHNVEDSIKVFLSPSTKLYEDTLKHHFISVDTTDMSTTQEISKESILDICVSLCVQKQGGTLMIKIGNTFSSLMIDVLYFVSHFYEKTYFIKPIVTDVTKSDKFLICKGFLFEKNHEFDSIHILFQKLLDYSSLPLSRILNIEIPLFYVSKLEEINSIFGQPQLEHIQVILNRIQTNHFKPPDLKQIPRMDIQKCIEWCSKYHVPFLS